MLDELKIGQSLVVAGTEVAKEILRQLGGNKFIAMTGAKNFIGGDNSLSFKFGRNKTQANFMHIKLTASDLYDVEFGYASVKGRKVLKKLQGVFFDQLQEIFSDFTGMATHL